MSEIKALPNTLPQNTTAWTAVTSSPNPVSHKNPLDVLMLGVDSGGNSVTPSYTGEGHAEMEIHGPLMPFGSVHVENAEPVFQFDGVYGINQGLVRTTVGLGGVATSSFSMLQCITGTGVGGNAAIQSRKRLRYRPGQGASVRFAGLFSPPASLSYQLLGMGHAEDGYYFGYNGTAFGIQASVYGVREVQTLTVQTASTSVGNATVTLAGVAYTVAVTSAASTLKTAYELSTATYAGWSAEQLGSTVIFLANSAGNKTGAFTVTGATLVGTIAETLAGQSASTTFIAQASWNVDPMDGSGPSGVTLIPLVGNVYQIDMQYLGFGAVVFKVMVAPANDNNPTWQIVHVIRNPNSLVRTHVSNPSFPFSMIAYSEGSTTNLTVSIGSAFGFTEGKKKLQGNRFSYFAATTAVDATAYKTLLTVRNDYIHVNRANQSVINLVSLVGAVKHTSPVILYLIRNAVLYGTPSFTSYSTLSCSSVDTASTTCAFTDNAQLVWSGHLGDTGDIDHEFEPTSEDLTIQPGETLTLAARAVTGSPQWVTGSLNTREDS